MTGDGRGVDPRLARLLRAVAWVFVGYTVIYWGFVRPAGFIGDDFVKHWHAARALAEGRSVYAGPELELRFNYPQAVAFIFAWLAPMEIAAAEKLWEFFHVSCLIAAGVLAWRGLRPAPPAGAGIAREALARHWGLAVALALALYSPATWNIWIGNIDPLNGLLAVGLTVALVHRRDAAAGGCWALLVLVKLLPVALAAPLVLWGRRRMLARGAVVFVLYLALLAGLGRLSEEARFFSELAPRIPHYWRGISISAGRALLTWGAPEGWADDPVKYRLAALGVAAVGGLLLIGWMGWLRRRGATLARALEPALLLVPTLSPLLEPHHYIYAFPVLVLQMGRFAGGRMRAGFAVAGMAGWLVLGQWSIALDHIGSAPLALHFVPLWAALWLLGVNAMETACATVDEPTVAGRSEG